MSRIRTSVGNALATQTIDYVHWEAHKGCLNTVSHVSTGLASTKSANYLIQTPTKEVHWKAHVSVNGPCRVRLWETPVLTAGTTLAVTSGTVLETINLNRNFTTSAATVVYHGPTLTTSSSGKQLFEIFLGNSATTANKDIVGGQARGHSEWIMATTQTYLITVANQAGVTVNMSLDAEFYEEG